MNTCGIWWVYYIDYITTSQLPCGFYQLLVARHIKVVVPGVREDDLASSAFANFLSSSLKLEELERSSTVKVFAYCWLRIYAFSWSSLVNAPCYLCSSFSSAVHIVPETIVICFSLCS